MCRLCYLPYPVAIYKTEILHIRSSRTQVLFSRGVSHNGTVQLAHTAAYKLRGVEYAVTEERQFKVNKKQDTHTTNNNRRAFRGMHVSFLSL